MPPISQPQAHIGGPNPAFGDVRDRKKRSPQPAVLQMKRSLRITGR